MRWALLAALLSGGCARLGRDELEHIDVASATLRDVELGTGGVVLGYNGGSGDLEIVDRSGEVFLVPVRLGGGLFGAALELSATVDPTNEAVFELPDEPITGDQLLGTYSGVGAGLAIGLGVTDGHLKNRHDVVLDKGWFTAGVSLMVDLRWLRIRVGEGDADADADTGAPTDTDETGDTSAPEPPPPDTGGTADTDAGAAEDQAGSGCDCDGNCCGSAGGLAAGVLLWPWWRRRRG
jgi:hypothetical protein